MAKTMTVMAARMKGFSMHAGAAGRYPRNCATPSTMIVMAASMKRFSMDVAHVGLCHKKPATASTTTVMVAQMKCWFVSVVSKSVCAHLVSRSVGQGTGDSAKTPFNRVMKPAMDSIMIAMEAPMRR